MKIILFLHENNLEASHCSLAYRCGDGSFRCLFSVYFRVYKSLKNNFLGSI